MRRHNRLASLIQSAVTGSFDGIDGWTPAEEDIFDLRVLGADGSVTLIASYRVDADGKMHWLTPDGNPPPGFASISIELPKAS